jgi:hypothetical protein
MHPLWSGPGSGSGMERGREGVDLLSLISIGTYREGLGLIVMLSMSISSHGPIQVVFAMIGKFGSDGAWSTLVVYSAEVQLHSSCAMHPVPND